MPLFVTSLYIMHS